MSPIVRTISDIMTGYSVAEQKKKSALPAFLPLYK
jgi:hypothetical protein